MEKTTKKAPLAKTPNTNNTPGGKLVPCYEVKVRGQYQAADGKNRILKTFGPVSFILPEYVQIPNGKKRVEKIVNGHKLQNWEPQFKKSAVTVENVALYIVQRRLLPPWLAENHPDCVTFRTCSIVPGGLRRVMRPEKETLVLDKPIEAMSLQELIIFCKNKNINLALAAFSDVKDAREAVLYELDLLAEAKKNGQTETESEEETTHDDENDDKKHGIKTSRGAVTSEDGVPTDNEDPAEDLL